MGDHDVPRETPKSRIETIGEQSRGAATIFNNTTEERYRVVIQTGRLRFTSDVSFDRITSALDEVLRIEREHGVVAFAVCEKRTALR